MQLICRRSKFISRDKACIKVAMCEAMLSDVASHHTSLVCLFVCLSVCLSVCLCACLRMRDGERYEERERRRRRLGDRWWELASSQSRRSRPDGDLIRNRRREKRFTTTSSSSSSSVSSISWRCDASRLSLTSTENYVVGAGAALCGRWRDAIREEAGKRRGVGTRANERPRPSVTSRHCSDSQREKRGVASWQFHARTDLHPAQFPICR